MTTAEKSLSKKSNLETTEMTPQITKYKYESLSETLEFAETLGWVDPDYIEDGGEWSDETADATEQNAIEYIEKQGITVIYD